MFGGNIYHYTFLKSIFPFIYDVIICIVRSKQFLYEVKFCIYDNVLIQLKQNSLSQESKH